MNNIYMYMHVSSICIYIYTDIYDVVDDRRKRKPSGLDLSYTLPYAHTHTHT